MKTQELWEEFLQEAEEAVNESTFNFWFKSLKIVSIDDKKVTIKIPLQVYKRMLEDEYIDLFNDIFFSKTGINYEFEFLTEEELNKVEILNSNIDTIVEENQEKEIVWDTHLNPNLNFNNYIIGDSNRLAYIGAMNVAQTPGTIYNPLFLYGRSGIGKTHLMHAIGNYITEHSNKKVLYTTSSDFRDEYVDISKIETGKDALKGFNNFKNKYRNVDVLIIDDIQSLVGSEQTQQEFFYTFEALHQHGKQIIISSDTSPNDLTKIEDRLKSRFVWGLSVDIDPPDFELRCDIIKELLKDSPYFKDKVSKDIIEYIANGCPNDVRHIQGTIRSLLAYTAMMLPKEITIDFVKEAINDQLATNPYQDNSISHIQKVVADYFKITVEDLKSKKRSANITKPRHIAMYLCRIETNEKLEKIGLEFGGKDHSTIVAASDKIKNELVTDTNLNNLLKEIKAKL